MQKQEAQQRLFSRLPNYCSYSFHSVDFYNCNNFVILQKNNPIICFPTFPIWKVSAHHSFIQASFKLRSYSLENQSRETNVLSIRFRIPSIDNNGAEYIIL